MLKNNPQDYTAPEDKLWGIYRGVVEDNNDPEELGRCKVRVFNIHTHILIQDELEGIPIAGLPWAEPALGLFEGSVTGFGGWTIPLQGSHVFVFFEGGHIHKPRFFATVPGLPTSKTHGYENRDWGFKDPNGEFPNSTINAPTKPQALGEPDWHKLARTDISDTCIEKRIEEVDTDNKKALESLENLWDEKLTDYRGLYPHNTVFATRTGITIELDNSTPNGRIHIYHPSHTYIEIQDDGDLIVRNAKDKYKVVGQDEYAHVKGNTFENIDGLKSTLMNEKADEIKTDHQEYCGESFSLQVENGKMKFYTNTDNIEIHSSKDVQVYSDQKIFMSAKDDINITSDKDINMDCRYMFMNSGTSSGVDKMSPPVLTETPPPNTGSNQNTPPEPPEWDTEEMKSLDRDGEEFPMRPCTPEEIAFYEEFYAPYWMDHMAKYPPDVIETFFATSGVQMWGGDWNPPPTSTRMNECWGHNGHPGSNRLAWEVTWAMTSETVSRRNHPYNQQGPRDYTWNYRGQSLSGAKALKEAGLPGF